MYHGRFERRCRLKLTIQKENLLHGLKTVVHAAMSDKATTMPILSMIYMAVDGNNVMLATTNLQVAIVTWIKAAEVEGSGKACVPTKTFVDVIRAMDGEIKLSLSKAYNLTITSGRSKSRIKCSDVKDYPPIKVIDPSSDGIKLDIVNFKASVNKVGIAAAPKNDVRPALESINFLMKGNDITLVSADGFRLAEERSRLEKKIEGGQMLIPAEALRSLARVLDDETLTMSFSEDGKVFFRTEDTQVMSLLLSGEFPDYKKIIPDKWTTRVVINNADLSLACKQASIFARDGTGLITFDITVKDDLVDSGVVVQSASEETGQFKRSLEAVVEGESLAISFNSAYLADLLSVMKDPSLVMEFTTRMAPALFKSASDENYLHVIMPMDIR